MDADEIATAIDEASASLNTLRDVQAGYDAVGWRVSDPKTAKFRHICLHLMDATAKLAMVAEHNDHQEDAGRPISDEQFRSDLHEHGLLVAELVFSILQIAEIGDIDLGAAYSDMLARNAGCFAPTSEYAKLSRREYDEVLVRHDV